MRLICAISCRTVFDDRRAGLVVGRSRPTISITPAIPASGLRISCASPVASSPRVARCSARDIWVRCRRSISSRLSRELLDHAVEVAAEVADFVVALCKADRDVEVAFAHPFHLFLQFDHGPLDEVGQHDHHHGADSHRSGSGNDPALDDARDRAARRSPSGRAAVHSAARSHGQDGLELPVHAHA